jgi:hypothetical protein
LTTTHAGDFALAVRRVVLDVERALIALPGHG